MKPQSKTAMAEGGFHSNLGFDSDAAALDFLAAISAAGLSPPKSIVGDGRFHRFASDGSRGDDAGWYVFHPDGVPSGAFGCFRHEIKRKWSARSHIALSTAEKQALRRRIADDRRARDKALAAERAEAQKSSAETWDSLPIADPAHAYLTKKKVGAYGIRQQSDLLVVPVRDISGTLHGLQFITADSQKWFLKGTAKVANLHLMGQPSDVFVVAEGYATSASIHEATGYAVAVAFDKGNLKPVAEAIRLKHPESLIIIGGDCDRSGNGQEKACIAAAACTGEAVIPEEPADWDALDGNKSIDWNDVAKKEGLDAVKAAFEAARVHASNEAAVKRLADLTPLKYDRVREDEARKLGVRVTTLDAEISRRRRTKHEEACDPGGFNLSDPELWPDPVSGAELLDSLVEIIKRYVVLTADAAVAVALWIMHSHAHDTAAISPILAVTSPTPECGKTTLLTILLATTRRPLPAANITPAAVFRSVDKWRPTLIIDEADTFVCHSQELRGVLDSGHNRMTAFVLRTVGDDHQPRRFSTWAPKAIALIGKLPATLESRSIHVELRRIADGEHVDDLRVDRLAAHEPLRGKCWRWACDHRYELESAEPTMPAALRGRSADNWRPLLAIADLVGGEWPEKARLAAEVLSNGPDGKTNAVMLLEDIRHIFQERKANRLTSLTIAAELGSMEHRPWPEWSKGKPITQTQIAKLLRPFHIAPGTIRADGTTGKGYYLRAFDDAFRRYLPPQAVTPSQPLETRAFSDVEAVTNADLVTAGETLDLLRQKPCDDVTDTKPKSGGEVAVEPFSGNRRQGAEQESAPGSASNSVEQGFSITPALRADDRPPDDMPDPVRAQNPEILDPLSDILPEEHDERAALAEFDGAIPRAWAEGLARLDPARAPADVPPGRWLRFIEDCDRFAVEWAWRASRLGWTQLALFGCDRTRPFARLDRAGLLWIVEGRRIVKLTADTAAIETPGGGQLTYRYKPHLKVEAVAVWDLLGDE